MTNFERYKEEILELITSKEKEKKDVGSGEITIALYYKYCNANIESCTALGALFKWGFSDYVESYKLTKFEKDVLESIDSKLKYIFKNGQSELIWIRKCKGYDYCCLNSVFPKIKLDCLKWDKEYKIADILGNCEVID